MVTKLENELPFDLEEETMCFILRKKINPKAGDQLKVYIPRVMRGIEMGEPEIKISPVQYHGAFANASDCKPKVSPILKEQNYLIGLYLNNTATKSVLKGVYDEYNDLIKAYIPGLQQVRCNFYNGKLRQLRLNTNNNMSYSANEFIFDEYVRKNDSGDGAPSPNDIVEEVDYDKDDDEEDNITRGGARNIFPGKR